MFTHPAILRALNQLADQLRRGGEMAWARRAVEAADLIRKAGWTEEGRGGALGLLKGEASLQTFSFGEEHSRRLGGGPGLRDANDALSACRVLLNELMLQPLRQTLPPGALRPRSPDLG